MNVLNNYYDEFICKHDDKNPPNELRIISEDILCVENNKFNLTITKNFLDIWKVLKVNELVIEENPPTPKELLKECSHKISMIDQVGEAYNDNDEVYDILHSFISDKSIFLWHILPTASYRIVRKVMDENDVTLRDLDNHTNILVLLLSRDDNKELFHFFLRTDPTLAEKHLHGNVLHQFISTITVETLESLIGIGANIHDGKLLKFAINSRVDVVEYLLKSGVKLDKCYEKSFIDLCNGNISKNHPLYKYMINLISSRSY